MGVCTAAHSFDGAIRVYEANNTNRAFSFDVTFQLDHPHFVALPPTQKPPLHFHPYQDEYIEVIEGKLGVDIEGKELKLGPEDGELVVRRWQSHRLYPIVDSSTKTAQFLLSGEETSQPFRLDAVFFQNWYGYQEKVILAGGKFDTIQVMNMFDAGDCYLSFPAYLPFGKRLAQVVGIIIGRWLGGLLGYQPFHRQWTTDWQTACKRMGTSIFLKRYYYIDKRELPSFAKNITGVQWDRSMDRGIGGSEGEYIATDVNISQTARNTIGCMQEGLISLA
ncbi:hypothetical protein F4814DRAFT_460893 [Daldinia grandis]|nr:hypothetical protein F4814DRAFT_460893 [Daldinia grandis]